MPSAQIFNRIQSLGTTLRKAAENTPWLDPDTQFESYYPRLNYQITSLRFLPSGDASPWAEHAWNVVRDMLDVAMAVDAKVLSGQLHVLRTDIEQEFSVPGRGSANSWIIGGILGLGAMWVLFRKK